VYGMVHQVRLVQSLEVATPWHQAKRPAMMHQAIMGDEVQRTVRRHARPDPFQRVPASSAKGNEQDRQHGEHHGIQVVLLEPALPRLVVRAVPAPAGTMHDVLVGQVGDRFHGGQGDQEGENAGDHGASSAAGDCWNGVLPAGNGSLRPDLTQGTQFS